MRLLLTLTLLAATAAPADAGPFQRLRDRRAHRAAQATAAPCGTCPAAAPAPPTVRTIARADGPFHLGNRPVTIPLRLTAPFGLSSPCPGGVCPTR